MKRAVGMVAAMAAVAGLVLVSFNARETAEREPVDPIGDAAAPARPPDAAQPNEPRLRPDARVAPPATDPGATPPAVIEAERTGLMFRDGEWIDRMVPRGWTVVGEGWRGPTGTEVRFALREGRVVGARATFAEAAFSSELSALTVPLIGHNDGGSALLPGGEEAESTAPETTPRTGTVRYPGGEIDWTLWLRTTGEAPFGPRRFDLGDVGPLDGSTGPGP